MTAKQINPYAAPQSIERQAADTPAAAIAHLRIPTTGLLLLAMLSIIGALHAVFVLVVFRSPAQPPFWSHVIFALVLVVPSTFISYGAWCMRRGRHYRLALLTALLASIPVVSPFMWLGIPFGIWALVVLRRADVRAAFAASSTLEGSD